MCHTIFIPKKKRVFIVKAEWRATALFLRIEALNEVEAMRKAWRQEGVKGCMDLFIVREVE